MDKKATMDFPSTSFPIFLSFDISAVIPLMTENKVFSFEYRLCSRFYRPSFTVRSRTHNNGYLSIILLTTRLMASRRMNIE